MQLDSDHIERHPELTPLFYITNLSVSEANARWLQRVGKSAHLTIVTALDEAPPRLYMGYLDKQLQGREPQIDHLDGILQISYLVIPESQEEWAASTRFAFGICASLGLPDQAVVSVDVP